MIRRSALLAGTSSLLASAADAPPPPVDTISTDGDPVFANFASLATWDLSRTFTTAANLILVALSFESAVTVNSVVVDPAGAAIGLSLICGISGTGAETNTRIYGAYNFAAQSGAKTVRTILSSAAQGSMGIWTAKDATKLPTTGDFSTVGSVGTSAVGSIPVGAGEEDGIIIAVMNANIIEAITAGGGLVNPVLHTNIFGSPFFTSGFSHNLGPLSGSETPSFSWTTNAFRSLSCVLAI